MMELSEFKSMYRSWNPFHYPDFNSLFPQPVLSSESSSSELVEIDPPNYEDPNRGLQNPAPPRDDLIVKGSLNLMNQPAAMTRVNKNRVAECTRCHPCNIMCNSKVSWEAHLAGKKHIKKTQALHDIEEFLETRRQKLEKGGAYYRSGSRGNV